MRIVQTNQENQKKSKKKREKKEEEGCTFKHALASSLDEFLRVRLLHLILRGTGEGVVALHTPRTLALNEFGGRVLGAILTRTQKEKNPRTPESEPGTLKPESRKSKVEDQVRVENLEEDFTRGHT